MASNKFTVSMEPTFFGRVYLICPMCKHRYQIRHAFCGMSPYIVTALETGNCDICEGNGQDYDAVLPEDFADCPKCGYKCRSTDDLDWNEPRVLRSHARTRRHKLPQAATQHLPQSCQICGFTEGLQIHHIDWNPNNNTPENLQRICQWCHVQASKLGKPEFDRLQKIVNTDPNKKVELRRTATKYYANRSRRGEASLSSFLWKDFPLPSQGERDKG